jgi:hypothetical protein
MSPQIAKPIDEMFRMGASLFRGALHVSTAFRGLPASLGLAAYFKSAADTLIKINFALRRPWARGTTEVAEIEKVPFSGLPSLSWPLPGQ